MIELRDNELVFNHLTEHTNAELRVSFQRTLRIPDDGTAFPLPPGLGRFPLMHVDDFGRAVPSQWSDHGGVMLPVYQAEALWVEFNVTYFPEHRTSYPWAVKIATGKINAVTGQTWRPGLHRRPQDYVVTSGQPWLDGYCVKKGFIRQFVAMPLGSGFTAEEQVTGVAEFGGLQILAIPMKKDVVLRRFPVRPVPRFSMPRYCAGDLPSPCATVAEPMAMGLAPGGLMKQDIYKDPFDPDDWDLEHASRCFVHICNSKSWTAITGKRPPTRPPTAAAYTQAGMPWFDYYSEGKAVAGSKVLAGLKSVATLGAKKRKNPLPENETVKVDRVIQLRRGQLKDQVREFAE
jgi:hypothetical protein